MKRVIVISVIIIGAILGSGFHNAPQLSNLDDGLKVPPTTQIDVYYFHYERRCATCLAVESVTENTLKSNYAAQMKQGDLTFQSINIEKKEGKDIAKKLDISGQTLVIIKGDKKVDLTSLAFMYVNVKPEKLEQAIKEEVDKLMRK